MNEKDKIINTSQISPDTHHSTPKSCLIVRGQQAVHSSQLSLQLEDLTVQTANLREDFVFLVSILQHHVVVLQIPHIGLQLLNASLDVQPSVLQLRLLQQRLLVFQVPTLTIPPVTNNKNLATYKIRKTAKTTTNLPKKIDIKEKQSPTTDIRQPRELTAN
jgi:hypothetical protein